MHAVSWPDLIRPSIILRKSLDSSKESCGRAMDPRVKPPGVTRFSDTQKIKSRLAAGPSCSRSCQFRLALGLLTRIGLLALTVGILLLLAGLLAAALPLATLLLAGLLTRVLILLARILVLVRHRDLPC